MTIALRHTSYAPPHRPVTLPEGYQPRKEWLKLADDGWWDFDNPSLSRWSWRGLAAAIAKQVRYNGNMGQIWSVADHSVLCHDQTPVGARFYALVHDLPEGPFGDIVQPVKAYNRRTIQAQMLRLTDLMTTSRDRVMVKDVLREMLEALDQPEHDLLHQIYSRAGFLYPSASIKQMVKEIDQRALITEMDQLNFAPDWPLDVDPRLTPFDTVILPRHRWQDSYEAFLDRLSLYVDLSQQR